MELQNPLNKPNRFAYGKDVTIINDNPPADQTFGVHKSAEQSGVSVTLEESHFMIWKLENGTYVEFGEVNQKSSIILGWTDGVDGYYFQSLTPTPKLEIRITGIAGNLVIDSDPNDGIGEGEANLLAFNGQINQGNIGTIGFGQKGEKGQKGEAGGYATSFNGPHSLGDDRNAGADLGTVTVDTDLSYQSGDYILVTMIARPDSFDIARVTSYDSSTGEMSFNNVYQSTSDSESTDWNINLTGLRGQDGESSIYVTSFNGPHSLGDDRNAGADLGTVTVDTGLSYQGGEYVIIAMAARPDSFDIAQVTSYDSSTGVMSFNNIYQSTSDSDSTDWNINLTGIQGEKGDKGEAGADGVIGVDGAKGDKGEAGTDGVIGVDGAKGDKGEAGLDGSATNQGQKGDKGESSDMGGTMTSHIIPDSNAAYDLGNAEYKIRHLFLSDSSMYIGDTWIKAEGDQIKTPNLLVGDINLNNEGRQNEVDGTSGHWLIQEGSNDLFLINRNTGKKYKFNLTEM